MPENALTDDERAAADAQNAGADIDRAWEVELGAKIDGEAGDDEPATGRREFQLLIVKKGDAPGLEEGGEDGVVDVALTVGVVVAQLVVGPDLVANPLGCRR